MKTVARYLDNDNNAFDGSYVSTLIKPNQVFVNGVVAYDPAKNVASGLLVDTTLPIVNMFTLTRGSDPTTVISTIITASDNDVVQDIYILLSATQTTIPTSMEIKVVGVKIPGNSTSYNVTGLSANTTYYGWAMAVDVSGNESIIVASTPAFLKTDPGISYYSFVVSEKADGVGGGLNIPGQIFIGSLRWNVVPSLSLTNVLRYRPFSTGPVENLVGATGIYVSYTNTSYNVGDELLYIETLNNVSTFTINYSRPIYRPGFKIYKNGVLVYTDASVATAAVTPAPFIVTYNV